MNLKRIILIAFVVLVVATIIYSAYSATYHNKAGFSIFKKAVSGAQKENPLIEEKVPESTSNNPKSSCGCGG